MEPSSFVFYGCQLVKGFHLPFFAWSFSPSFGQALDLAKASC
jgi:hypothetical protein